MSNRPKPKAVPGKGKSLDQYRSEVKGDPFVLPVDDEETITIPRPTGDQLLEVEEAVSSRDVVKVLCGDQADRLLEVLGPEDGSVMKAVAADMKDHFGLEN